MEINRQREQTTLMKNYQCLFCSQIPLASRLKKTVQFVSGTTGHSCALQLSSDTRTCHCRERLKCQGTSAAVSLATASFKAMKTFQDSSWDERASLGHQIQMSDCAYLSVYLWLRGPEVSVHSKASVWRHWIHQFTAKENPKVAFTEAYFLHGLVENANRGWEVEMEWGLLAYHNGKLWHTPCPGSDAQGCGLASHCQAVCACTWMHRQWPQGELLQSLLHGLAPHHGP